MLSVLVLLAVFTGAVSQRMTGMGFALIAAPFLVILLGPVTGVILVNLCSALASVFIVSRMWKYVEWRRYRALALWALVGIPPGALLARLVPAQVLEISIGILVVLAVCTSVIVSRTTHRISEKRVALAGFASGLMSVTAGVGGPAISTYAVLTRWSHQGFVATVQPYFITISAAAVAAKLISRPLAWPQLDAIGWIGVGIALLLGLQLGDRLAKIVPIPAARAAMIILAIVGGFAVLVKGLLAL